MSKEDNVMNSFEEQANELMKERFQKLKELQANGKDPFDVYKVERTHTSKEVKENYEDLEGKTVYSSRKTYVKKGSWKSWIFRYT